jgi:FkbH-like protein
MMPEKWAELIQQTRDLKSKVHGPPYRIGIISNVVIDQMRTPLEWLLFNAGIAAQIEMGDYDQLVQNSLKFRNHDAVVILLDTGSLVPELHARADELTDSDLQSIVETIEASLKTAIQNLSSVPKLLISKFSSFAFRGSALRTTALDQISDQLNLKLLSLATPNIQIISIDSILAEVGISKAIDRRGFATGRALFSEAFLRSYSRWIAPVFLASRGRTRKVIVLDCDNTLWGGILGEDGEEGVHLGPDIRAGRAYWEAQYVLKSFKRRGALLAVCTKNNESDIQSIFQRRKEMVLRLEDFVCVRANWENKASNIRSIATELNVGLDSLVFIDDSDFELGLIADQLPMVALMKASEPLSDYPSLLQNFLSFHFPSSGVQTLEDKRRTEMLQEEAQRKNLAKSFQSVDDYLASLELKMEISWNSEVPIDRAAQLTQKTNQFNLTTRRYSEGEIRALVNSRQAIVATFALADRHGDYGTTGLSVIRLDPNSTTAEVDTFLMSCRVIGRSVEFAFWSAIIERLRSIGIRQVHASFVATAKNHQVKDFFDSVGLGPLSKNSTETSYRSEVNTLPSIAPKFITVSERKT